jgi:hypothetical protein
MPLIISRSPTVGGNGATVALTMVFPAIVVPEIMLTNLLMQPHRIPGEQQVPSPVKPYKKSYFGKRYFFMVETAFRS